MAEKVIEVDFEETKDDGGEAGKVTKSEGSGEVKPDIKPDIKPEPSKSVPIGALVESRSKNRELKAERDDYKAKLDVAGKLLAMNKPKESDKLAGDEAATINDVRVMLQELANQSIGDPSGQIDVTAQPVATPAELTEEEVKEMMKEGRAFYTDFDVVLEEASKIMEANPMIADAIRNSENPPLAAYEIAKGQGATTMSEEKPIEEPTDDAAQRIKFNSELPKTATTQGAGGKTDAVKYTIAELAALPLDTGEFAEAYNALSEADKMKVNMEIQSPTPVGGNPEKF